MKSIKVSNETYDEMVMILKKYGLNNSDLGTAVAGFLLGCQDLFEEVCRILVEAKKEGSL